MNNTLKMISQFAVQFMYSVKDSENKQLARRIHAAPAAPLIHRRNHGFTLASIMGKIDQEQVCHKFIHHIFHELFNFF